tara:strand:- start:24496 stop:25032 length:537 start_codon:yes stop_codon:yes gene_type:complete
MSNYKFKTTNIKGKEYVEVNQRIKFFRSEDKYKGWSLQSETVHLDSDSCVIKATIADDKGYIIATGFAQEDKSSSYINKTSYVENCETSAWGRALANLGIGIDTSIASSNEVSMAVAKQSSTPKAATPKVAVKESTLYQKAVLKIKDKPTQEYYDQIMSKASDKFTDKEKEALKKLIK